MLGSVYEYEERIRRKGIVCTVYDPCCGSGGMLMIAKEHITIGLRKNGDLLRPGINPHAEIHLFACLEVCGCTGQTWRAGGREAYSQSADAETSLQPPAELAFSRADIAPCVYSEY